jgi:mono/diheme cytochrome c family protein
MSRVFPALMGLAVSAVWLSRAFAALEDGAPSAGAGSNGWRIPEIAATERSPLSGNPAELVKGLALYRAKCTSCHGADGRGHGRDSDPDHPAGDLTDGRAAARNPDGVLFYKIWNGRAKPKMPAMKVDLPREDVWRVVAYIKTLRR